MTIRANIKNIKRGMLLEVGETKRPVSDKVQQRALRAVLEGQGQDQGRWQEYMELFVDPGNKVQLDRLMAKDTTKGDLAMDSARAYLVSDGTCGTDTVTNFGNAASELLDLGL